MDLAEQIPDRAPKPRDKRPGHNHGDDGILDSGRTALVIHAAR